MAYVRDHIKNPDCKFYRTSNGLFVLHYACEQGAGGAFISHFFSVDVILELLRAGFDINQPDIYGRTPLHWAALLLDCDLFVLLVQAGADLHKRVAGSRSPVLQRSLERRPSACPFPS